MVLPPLNRPAIHFYCMFSSCFHSALCNMAPLCIDSGSPFGCLHYVVLFILFFSGWCLHFDLDPVECP